ncbi:snare associated Golgi protein-domain-containing protein [Spinellus fusiger]|nr:snare associated Golgi protein-domain-containing protein [Spinellus fusiger]
MTFRIDSSSSQTLLGEEAVDFTELDDKPIEHEADELARPTWKSLVPRLLFFITIALFSLLFTVTLAHQVLGITLPRTLKDAQSTATQLEELSSSSLQGSISVACVFSVVYLWQQAFSVPGSVLLNLLASYVHGIIIGTLWTSVLTAVGATLAYYLALLVGKPFMQIGWVSRRAQGMIQQVRNSKSNTEIFWWLLFIRLFPFTPYWFINMISSLLGISVVPFFYSTLLGSMPYNFVCAEAGDVLGDLTSTSDIFSLSLVLKLLAVSCLSLVPVIWGKSIQRKMRQCMGIAVPLSPSVS